MTPRGSGGQWPGWFRELLETLSDVYFRFELAPARRFVYLSPSVAALTGEAPERFYEDGALCLGFVCREDRPLLRRVLRARRAQALTLRIVVRGVVVPVAVRTVPVVRDRSIVAVEGVVMRERADVGGAGGGPGSAAGEPAPQALAALMFQVHELLHRAPPPLVSAPASCATLQAGDVVLDLERLTVTDRGKPVGLTSREVLVLRYLMQRPGRVVTRQQLLADVWSYTHSGYDRTIDVHVSRLRRKLPSLRGRLVAIKHVGYRLDADVRRAANE